MPLDPQKKKQMDAIFKSTTGVKPQEVLGGGLPPIQDRIAQLRGKKPVDISPRAVFGEMGQDIKQTGQGIKEDVNKRLDTVNEIQNSDASGVRKATQVFGQGLGAFQDVLGQGFKGLAKVMLAPEQEQQVKEGVGKVVGKVVETKPVQSLIEGYAKLEQTNPKAARDVDTAVNTLMTILDVAGAGSASAIKNAGEEAIQQGLKTAGKGIKATGRAITAPVRAIGDVVGDAVPSLDRVVNSTATKALNLLQGDVKNISKSTGNEPGQWLGKNNLIKNTAEETTQAIKAKGDESYAGVRNEIGKVTKSYKADEVPRYKQSLEAIRKQVDGVPGLESAQKEVSDLLKKEEIILDDVQRVKELMDEHFNLYKATGDVAESTAKEGLANMRKDMKEFLETEVKKETGVDIRPLNNDVATARSLEDAISTRSTRGLTRSNFSLYDFGAFGAGMAAAGPLGGAIAIITKKILQTPAVGLRFARWLDKISDARKAKLKAELEAGNIPDEIEKVLGMTEKQVDDIVEGTDITSSISKAKANGQSFNDWIKGQGETVYHGTAKDSVGKIEKSGFKEGKAGDWGKGIYTTKDKMSADMYGDTYGGKTIEAIIPSNRIYDYKDFVLNKEKASKDIAKRIIENNNIPETLKGMNVDDLAKRISETFSTENPKFWLEKAGYAGIKDTDRIVSQIKDEIVIFNPKEIKTRSQLKAEWDKVKLPSKNTDK